MLLAGLGLVISVPVATWWLVGDLSTVSVDAGRDYAFQPWPVAPVTERALGIAALTVGLSAVAVLGWATRRRVMDARWWTVLVPLLAAGGIAGFSWRVMTAGVIGANIGAGLCVIVGGPVVAALLLFSLARAAVVLLRARRMSHPVPG